VSVSSVAVFVFGQYSAFTVFLDTYSENMIFDQLGSRDAVDDIYPDPDFCALEYRQHPPIHAILKTP
jgi:hypothetical protein